jgi:hypothetical protein
MRQIPTTSTLIASQTPIISKKSSMRFLFVRGEQVYPFHRMPKRDPRFLALKIGRMSNLLSGG